MTCSCDQSTSVPYAASDKASQLLTCLSFNYSFPRIEWRSSIHDIERLRLSSHHDSKEVSSQHRFCSCKHEFGVANHNSFAYNVYHQQKKGQGRQENTCQSHNLQPKLNFSQCQYLDSNTHGTKMRLTRFIFQLQDLLWITHPHNADQNQHSRSSFSFLQPYG